MATPRTDNCTNQELFGMSNQLSQSQQWLTRRFQTPRLISLAIHVAIAGLALIPWTSALPAHPRLVETAVILYTPADIIIKPVLLPNRSGGGGGGGKHQPTPA